jgi:hypothetical protein
MPDMTASFRIEMMEPFPPGSNPMHMDGYHMGTVLGPNVMLLHANHREETMQYVILVHLPSGSRMKVFFPEYDKASIPEQLVETMLGCAFTREEF